jgi:plastocyanin
MRTAVCSSLLALAAVTRAGAVEPGVDIAAPRVAISDVGVGGGFTFTPATLRVEPEDYVRWRWNSGTHSTTSGSACSASGLWNVPMTSASTSFTRQFLEAPGTIPFFCTPHCSFMSGQVIVTTTIQVSVADNAGTVDLTWSGGAAPYRVYRSDSPLFGAGTQVLTPVGGIGTTAFSDASGTAPALDKAFYYLVMNEF